MNQTSPRLCLIALIACFLASCASSGPKPTATLDEVLAQDVAAKQKVEDLNRQVYASVNAAPQMKDYIIQDGDLLAVSVFAVQDLNREVRVSARGLVTLALLGPVKVAGLTAQEAEQKIEDAYRNRYLKNPHVTIFVKEQHGSQITLLGAVKKPGTYDYFSRQHLLAVLAMAGGLTDNAGMMVQVRRAAENKKNKPSAFLIDMDELVKKGHSELNIVIRGGDVVYVPEAGTVYVYGAVRRPGNYSIKQAMTVREAIVAAGGFNAAAEEGKIDLVRLKADGNREVVQLSMNEATGGSADRLPVRDRDVVFVATNKVEALFYSLRMSFGMGLVGLGFTPPQ